MRRRTVGMALALGVACSGATDRWGARPELESCSSSELVLNEAAPSGELLDEAGELEDWIELYNAGSTEVDVAGWGLTDAPEVSRAWSVQERHVVEPGGRVLLVADGAPEQGPLHLDFRLAREGETLALVDPAGCTADRATLPELDAGRSWGRHPDGEGPFEVLAPTPGEANALWGLHTGAPD